jgi:glycosyltransferase involved in cell wall biosynthesis
MKFIYVTDAVFYCGNDGEFYADAEYAISYIIELLPQLTEFVIWGRLQKTDTYDGKFKFPRIVGSCRVVFRGPYISAKSRLNWPFLLLKTFLPLRREVRSSDIIFLKIPAFFPLVASYLVCRKKVIVSYMVGNPRETIPLLLPKLKIIAWIMGFLCTRLISKSDLNSFVSKKLRDEYGTKSKVSIVTNDCRFSKSIIIKNKPFEPNIPPHIVYLGRLSKEKGIDTLLRAFSIVRRKMECKLDVFGSGPMFKELVAISQDLHINSDVIFHGRVACGEPLYKAYKQGDVFVLPSFSEGMPSCIPEAMSQGLPVIASSVGGIPDILLNGRAGILVTPRDFVSLADAIEKILTDWDLRRKLIASGLEQAYVNCLENQTGKFVEEIKKIIRQKYNK